MLPHLSIFGILTPNGHPCRVPTAQGKQGKWPKKIPVRENTGNLEMLSKHREFCLNTGKIQGVSSVYVILTNYVNWHRENLQSDRENTGNLKCNLSGYPALSSKPICSIHQGQGWIDKRDTTILLVLSLCFTSETKVMGVHFYSSSLMSNVSLIYFPFGPFLDSLT